MFNKSSYKQQIYSAKEITRRTWFELLTFLRLNFKIITLIGLLLLSFYLGATYQTSNYYTVKRACGQKAQVLAQEQRLLSSLPGVVQYICLNKGDNQP